MMHRHPPVHNGNSEDMYGCHNSAAAVDGVGPAVATGEDTATAMMPMPVSSLPANAHPHHRKGIKRGRPPPSTGRTSLVALSINNVQDTTTTTTTTTGPYTTTNAASASASTTAPWQHEWEHRQENRQFLPEVSYRQQMSTSVESLLLQPVVEAHPRAQVRQLHHHHHHQQQQNHQDQQQHHNQYHNDHIHRREEYQQQQQQQKQQQQHHGILLSSSAASSQQQSSGQLPPSSSNAHLLFSLTEANSAEITTNYHSSQQRQQSCSSTNNNSWPVVSATEGNGVADHVHYGTTTSEKHQHQHLQAHNPYEHNNSNSTAATTTTTTTTSHEKPKNRQATPMTTSAAASATMTTTYQPGIVSSSSSPVPSTCSRMQQCHGQNGDRDPRRDINRQPWVTGGCVQPASSSSSSSPTASTVATTTVVTTYDDDNDDDDDRQGYSGAWELSHDLEEMELSRQILDNVVDGEDIEFFMQQPSMVHHLRICPGTNINDDTNPDGADDDDDDDYEDLKALEPWTVRPPSRQHRRLYERQTPDVVSSAMGTASTKSNENRYCKVLNVEDFQSQYTETEVPRQLAVLFTPVQFRTSLLDKVEKLMPEYIVAGDNWSSRTKNRLSQSTLSDWTARLTVDHPNNPDGYLLEARGPSHVLDLLHAEAQSFFRAIFLRHNKERTLKNEQSLFVDISVGRTEMHGVVLEDDSGYAEFNSGSGGAWIKKLKVDKAVALALKIQRTPERKILVTAVDDVVVNSREEFKFAVQKAKKQRRTTNYTLTLCLCKSFDLLEAPGLSSLDLRYRDGTLFDYKEYEFQRALKEQDIENTSTQNDEPSWIDYPPDESYERPDLPRIPPTRQDEIVNAYEEILKNDQSVEIDLVLPENNNFGAEVHQCKGGLYVTNISPDGFLGKVLGKEAARNGCVLLKLNGVHVETWDDVTTYALSDGKWLCTRATVALFDGSDLSQIDTSHFVRRRPNPRRRNGNDFYPLHPWSQNQAAAGASQSNSNPSKRKRHLDDRNDSSHHEDILMDYKDNDLGCSDGKTVENGRKRLPEKEHPSDRPIKACRILLTQSGSNDSTDKSGDDQDPHSGTKRFHQFRVKFRDLCGLDFKDTKIMLLKCCGSMWSQHKKLMGVESPCDDRCNCIEKLAELGSTVLTDNVDDGGQDPKTLRKLTCGIFCHFGPIFMPKLKEQYPTETPDQLLSRLVDMWQIHRSNRRFYKPCRAECECIDEWDGLFGRGDKDKAAAFKISSTARSSSTANRASINGPAIPRKKNGQTNSSNLYPAHDSLNSQGRRDDSTLHHLGFNPRQRPFIKQGTFEEVLPTSQSLGAYFFTGKGPNGSRRCRIASVNPNSGPLAMNPNVFKNTSVAGYYRGNQLIEITSYEELMKQYDISRRQNKPFLRIKLDTQGSRDEPAVDSADWAGGKWIGNRNVGWDGSLPIVSERRSEPGSFIPREEYEIVASQKELPSLRDAQAPKSILLSAKSSKSEKKSIKFKEADFLEQIYTFDKDQPTTHKRILRVQRSARNEHLDMANNRPAHLLPPMGRFMDAVQNKTVKEVLEVLADGASSDNDIVQYGMKDAKKWLKEALDLPSRSPFQKEDLQAKLKVLRIYISAVFAIPESLYVTKWHRVDVQIMEMSLQTDESNKYDDKHVMGKVYQQVFKGDAAPEKQELMTLRPKVQTQFISYAEDSCSFYVLNNCSVAHDKRQILVEFVQSTARPLGTVVFDVDEIDNSCKKDDPPITISRPLTVPRLGPAKSGSLTLSVRKRRPVKEYTNRKKEEAEKRLKHVIEDIQRFNKEEFSKGIKIPGNLCGLDEYSLLHAAVSLGMDAQIIDALLDLGGDPNHKSLTGETAVKIASSHYEKASEYKQRYCKSLDESVLEPEEMEMTEEEIARKKHQEQKCEEAKLIWGTLKSHQSLLNNAPHASYEHRNDRTDINSDRAEAHQPTRRASLSDNDHRSDHNTKNGSQYEWTNADVEFFCDIIRKNSSAKFGGAALKSVVGSRLRATNPARFPHIDVLHAFLAWAISTGVVEETGEGKVRLLKIPSTTRRKGGSPSRPKLPKRPDADICRFFAKGLCKYGENCRYKHTLDRRFDQESSGRSFEHEGVSGRGRAGGWNSSGVGDRQDGGHGRRRSEDDNSSVSGSSSTYYDCQSSI